ncbi:hypothetical protein ACFL6E_04835 [Candidatus Neomarinimicrobiota bacterium]
MTDLFQTIAGNPLLLFAAIVFIVLIAITIVKKLIKWAFIVVVIAALFIYYEVQQGKDVDEAVEDVITKVESVDVKQAMKAGEKMLEEAKEAAEDAAAVVKKAKEAVESAAE